MDASLEFFQRHAGTFFLFEFLFFYPFFNVSFVKDALFSMHRVFTLITLLNMVVSVVYYCIINPLKPNDAYRRRTAPLTSKVAFYIVIQQI